MGQAPHQARNGTPSRDAQSRDLDQACPETLYGGALMARTDLIRALAGLAVAAGCFGASAAGADGLIAAHKIPAALASEAAAEAVAACAKQNYAETAVVVDTDGVRIALLRGDGAGAHTLDSAFYKAYTAASFKADSTAVVERAK